jgi:hypothetical protein
MSTVIFCDDCKKEVENRSYFFYIGNDYTFHVDFTYWPAASESSHYNNQLQWQNNRDLCRECLVKLLKEAMNER